MDHDGSQKRSQRLDKVLGNQGIGSRKEIRRLARSGRITVNDQIVHDPAIHVMTTDRIQVDGNIIHTGPITLMLNKPPGVVTARKDSVHRTIFDLLPPGMAPRLFPAGRLDKDSEGLLIVTDDGQLCHRLISPRYGIEKEYLVTVDKAIADDLVGQFAEGVRLKDGTETRPATLHIIDREAPGRATITIREGKYHQVRRMFAWAGLHVTLLRRIRIGALRLPDDLHPGQHRLMAQEEVALLLEPLNSKPSVNYDISSKI